MDSRDLLRHLDTILQQAFRRGLGANGLEFGDEGTDGVDAELSATADRLKRFISMINEAYRFAGELANGNLEATVSRDNILAMPMKALQSNLRHLSWQTSQVAAGDLNQEVHFLGEFSQSFNSMIEALRDKQKVEQRLQTITDVLGEGVCLLDAAGGLIFMNPEAEKLLGYSFEELANQPLLTTIHIQNLNGSRFAPDPSPLALALYEGWEYRSSDIVFTCKSGALMPVSVILRPILENDRLNGAVLAFHDISEQKKYQESLRVVNEILEKQATTDALTGIYNRLKINTTLQSEVSRSKRYGSPLSVILLDIDKFKSINDTFGHLEGDNVLKELATLVSANIRGNDLFARWGGEEFMILAPCLQQEQALEFAEKLRGLVAGHAFSIRQQVTASFGVAILQLPETPDQLTSRADSALYLAKQNGRNRVEMA